MSANDDPMGGYDRKLGPGLDRLFPVRLPGGRKASVARVSLAPTNAGILEGGLFADVNKHLRASWIAGTRRQHGDPVHVVEPPVTPLPGTEARERLPWMACAATLISSPTDPDMVESRLTLVWWQDPSDEPLRTWIERAAAGIAWSAVARDVDLP